MSKQQVIECLKQVPLYHALHNHISEVIIKEQHIGFTIYIESKEQVEKASHFKELASEALTQLYPDNKISIAISNHESQSKAQRDGSNVKKQRVARVTKVIPVISGKGGVGKSTVSVLLAESLVAQGYKVGLLDADIYGPSIPLFFQIAQKPEIIDNKFQPIISRGIEVMSIGLLVEDEQALSWRGPMITKSLNQLLMATSWGLSGDLDYLIIDTPPGTGDIHLSLLKGYDLYGAVLVSTPHILSLADTLRIADLYAKFSVNFLGLVVNFRGNDKLDNLDKIIKDYQCPLLASIDYNNQIADHSSSAQALLSVYDILKQHCL